MSDPTDETLYRKVKSEVDESYTKPSAYRSMAYTRFYLKAYKDKYGNTKGAYKGKKPGELKQWRNEKWIDVKSYLENPQAPTACGNEPYGKGEYPLCMPQREAAKYSKGELELLVKRKSELGSKRLVKDAYLRDVLKPEEIPRSRIYKQKYAKDKTQKLPKPLPEKQAQKILDEKPIGVVSKEMKAEVETEVEKERRPRGRPRLSDEQREVNKQASLAKRKESRAVLKQQNAEKREEARKVREEERARAKQEALANKPPRKTRAEKSENVYENVVIQRGSFPVRFD
jgi:hypothetical protein